MGKKQKKPGKGKEKTEKKTVKSEMKRNRREEKKTGGEDNIDAILAKFEKEAARKVAVEVIENVEPPSPRCNCSVTLNPLNPSEVILYGGEYYNGNKTYVYGDLYRFNIEKNEWKSVSSPNSPPPRSAHQAVAWKTFLYVFGGEFTSPNQERFHHYKDLWRLDLQSNAWEQLQLKGGPTARSGHRMVLWKHKILLFGGFYDTLREVRYYNDLFVLDLDEMKWTEVRPRPGSAWPSPRSACQLALCGDEVYLYGGYFKDSKAQNTSTSHTSPAGSGGKGGKSGEKLAMAAEKGVVHSDMWTFDPRSCEWYKVKRLGQPPSPRAGSSLVVHKKRAILFGGVVDTDDKDVLKSVFLNDMFVFQMDSRRWFTLQLRKAKGRTKDKKRKPNSHVPTPSRKAEESGEEDEKLEAEEEGEDSDGWDFYDKAEEDLEGEQEEEEEAPVKSSSSATHEICMASGDQSNASRAPDSVDLNHLSLEDSESAQKIAHREKVEACDMSGEAEENSKGETSTGKEEEVEERGQKGRKEEGKAEEEEGEEEEGPCGRMNAILFVSGSHLFVFGGMMEIGDEEVTLDDLYRLDLSKLDSWHCLKEASHSEWMEVEEGEEEEEEEEDEEDECGGGKGGRGQAGEDREGEEEERAEEEGEEDGVSSAAMAEAAAALLRGEGQKGKRLGRKERRAEIERIRSELQLSDSQKTPLPGESLRDFFARTSLHWQTAAYQRTQHVGKELRRDGFDLCEVRYKDLRPVLDELERLEREQKEEEAEEAAAKLKASDKGKRLGAGK